MGKPMLVLAAAFLAALPGMSAADDTRVQFTAKFDF